MEIEAKNSCINKQSGGQGGLTRGRNNSRHQRDLGFDLLFEGFKP